MTQLRVQMLNFWESLKTICSTCQKAGSRKAGSTVTNCWNMLDQEMFSKTFSEAKACECIWSVQDYRNLVKGILHLIWWLLWGVGNALFPTLILNWWWQDKLAQVNLWTIVNITAFMITSLNKQEKPCFHTKNLQTQRQQKALLLSAWLQSRINCCICNSKSWIGTNIVGLNLFIISEAWSGSRSCCLRSNFYLQYVCIATNAVI